LLAVMLSDQGADVVHVDPPGGPRWGMHEADAFLNRGKRRISLDLASAADHDVAARLVARADVVIEGFRPGVMDRLGLGADARTGRPPHLGYCCLPGFAGADPRAAVPAWEGVLKAATDDCRPRFGEAEVAEPFLTAIPTPSNFAAFLGAIGVVAGLIARA